MSQSKINNANSKILLNNFKNTKNVVSGSMMVSDISKLKEFFKKNENKLFIFSKTIKKELISEHNLFYKSSEIHKM